MTRNDYSLMASYFAKELTKENRAMIIRLVSGFITVATNDNPKFRKRDFLLACGL
jgi:hypothetical protein